MSRTRIALTSAALAIVMTGTAWTVLGAPALQRGERVYTPGHGVSLPAVTSEVHPFYTPEAMAARIAGTVEMGCVVRPNGTATDVTIARSLDAVYGLDAQAVKALKEWRFTPGMKDGKPVAVEMTFTLK
jgi:protein TonB